MSTTENQDNGGYEELNDVGVQSMAYEWARYLKSCKDRPNYHKTIENYYGCVVSPADLQRVSTYYHENVKKKT